MLYGPIDILFAYDQRRRKTNNGLVRFFAEDTSFAQGLTIRPCGDGQFHANEQAFAAYFFDYITLDACQPALEVGAKFGRALRELFIDQDIQSGPADGCAQGIAAKGAAVVTRAEEAQDCRGRPLQPKRDRSRRSMLCPG